jgi:hypothetical protein
MLGQMLRINLVLSMLFSCAGTVVAKDVEISSKGDKCS